MRTFSFLTALIIALGTVLTPMTVKAEELTNSPQFRYRAHRTRAISRPSHRSVERKTKEYRKEMAKHRRDFQSRLEKIEEIRDTIRDEFIYEPDPGNEVYDQGFIRYHWYRTHRHVRNLYWNSYFRGTPQVKLGQGPAADTEYAPLENATDESALGK